jgi:hypothetical protein
MGSEIWWISRSHVMQNNRPSGGPSGLRMNSLFYLWLVLDLATSGFWTSPSEENKDWRNGAPWTPNLDGSWSCAPVHFSDFNGCITKLCFLLKPWDMSAPRFPSYIHMRRMPWQRCLEVLKV